MAVEKSGERPTGSIVIEESVALRAFLDMLAWSARAEPHKLRNAVDVTRGDNDLFAGVADARPEGRDGHG